MYTPAHFASDDLRHLDALVARDAFATLVTVIDGEPFANHLPVSYRRDGDAVVFRGHWARSNPQWQHLGSQSALLIVHGPHAHISPSWYVNANVPTWNYLVAHVRGRLALVEDGAALEAAVTELAEKYEALSGSNWHFAKVDAGTRRQLGGIVGFELVAERVELKLKLSQHHSIENLQGAVDGLRARDRRGDQEIAALMEAVLVEKRDRRTAVA